MAKEFLDLVPKHQMIKFTKNGSTATSAAVKLARAKTNRKYIAFPSDQPFFSYDDWFIGKTSCNRGVPDEISNLSLTFESCNLDALNQLFKSYPNQIAGIIMEPGLIPFSKFKYNEASVKNYLEEAIKITQSNGALFILDEMVTGFKVDFPGAISRYNLNPDLATWGKGISNGFSFCALTGKKEVMELGGILNKGEEKVFLTSTTHGGETHSIRAALKTIEIFKKNQVIVHNHKMGDFLISRATEVIRKYDIEKSIKVIPCKWIVVFTFKNPKGEDCSIHRTFFIQEMINQNILFQGVFIPCYDHKKREINFFIKGFEKAVRRYIEAYNQKSIHEKLTGDPTKPVFRKYL